MVAIGKVVFTSREHIIALEARGKGLLGVTLRYPYEVRNEAHYHHHTERHGGYLAACGAGTGAKCRWSDSARLKSPGALSATLAVW